MVASRFFVYGPEIGASESYIRVDVKGIDFKGKVQLQDKHNNNYTVTTDELAQMQNDNLIMTKAEANNADQDLVKAFRSIPRLPAEASNDAKAHLANAREEIFRATVRSAE
jgi:hypothetical protein